MKKIFILLLAVNIMNIAAAQVPNISSAAGGAGKLISQLVGGIKPSSFLDAFASKKSSWLSNVAKLTDAGALGKSVGELAGFIKPGMFKSGFDVSKLISSASAVKSLSGVGGLLKNLSGGLKPEAMTSEWAGQKAGWESALGMLK